MNIPYNSIKPFEPFGLPIPSTVSLVAIIDEVISKFFSLTYNEYSLKGLGVRMEMATIVAGASDANCETTLMHSKGYLHNWVYLEFRVDGSDHWHTRKFLISNPKSEPCDGG